MYGRTKKRIESVMIVKSNKSPETSMGSTLLSYDDNVRKIWKLWKNSLLFFRFFWKFFIINFLKNLKIDSFEKKKCFFDFQFFCKFLFYFFSHIFSLLIFFPNFRKCALQNSVVRRPTNHINGICYCYENKEDCTTCTEEESLESDVRVLVIFRQNR